LLEAYRSSDVVLNPSLGEGMPNTVLEAMACGVAVIASRVNGNDELVAHGETGLLFDLADADALGAAIANLASDDESCRTMGARAREVACAQYSWDATAAQYAALFQRD
jgi:glycosyltransferase involved in cell wall biosynthesis